MFLNNINLFPMYTSYLFNDLLYSAKVDVHGVQNNVSILHVREQNSTYDSLLGSSL